MAKIDLPYLMSETNRHGKRVFYVRAGKGPRMRIPASGPQDPQFLPAYQAALATLTDTLESARALATDPQKAAPRPKRAAIGTLAHAIGLYRGSASLQHGLAPTGRKRHLACLERLALAFAGQPASAITKQGLQAALGSMTPGAATSTLKIYRRFFNWAVDEGLAIDNPASQVRVHRPRGAPASDGFVPWRVQDVQARRAAWPIGTPARMALEVLIATQARAGDAISLGRQHITPCGTRIMRRANKTAHTSAETIDRHITPELRACIDAAVAGAHASGELALITNSQGKAMTSPNNFQNHWKKWQREAGFAQPINLHGVRKLAAEIVASGGGSLGEIMAINQHSNPKTAMHYAKRAETRRNADAAAQMLASALKSKAK